MRFGLCCQAEQARSALDAGFDFVEVPAFNLHETWQDLEGLPVETTNLLLPGKLRVFPSGQEAVRSHVLQVVALAAIIGVRVMVFGSGGQRRSEPGVPVDQALEEFASLCDELNVKARQKGLEIAPESLNQDETNVGNDLPGLAACLNRHGVGYTVDSYHVLKEAARAGIQPDWTEELRFPPLHVHVANLQRVLPEVDDPAVAGMFQRLRELGYDSRMSFEGSLGDAALAEVPPRLREMWLRAEG